MARRARAAAGPARYLTLAELRSRTRPKENVMTRFHPSPLIPLAALALAAGLPAAVAAAPAAAATT